MNPFKKWRLLRIPPCSKCKWSGSNPNIKDACYNSNVLDYRARCIGSDVIYVPTHLARASKPCKFEGRKND